MEALSNASRYMAPLKSNTSPLFIRWAWSVTSPFNIILSFFLGADLGIVVEAAKSRGHKVKILDTLKFSIDLEEENPDLYFKKMQVYCRG